MDWKARIPALVVWLVLLFSSIEDGNAEQRIVCYYTNWSVYRPGTAKFSPQNINPYLCTHLIYAFGGFTKDNTLKPFDKYQDIEKGGYAKFTGLKTYNKNLKTMLAIGGWNEGSSRFSPMVADAGRRKEFVKNSVKFLRQNHFDGLDLDWEYPAFRDGGKPRDRNNYADLVQELREEFERESSKTGRPRLLLSMAVPAGIEYIDKGYDIPRLNDYLDFINLLSYDYHSAFEPAVNHHAPLYPLEEDNEYNYDTELTIDYTIKHLLKSGATSEKIVLGIPTYGRSYTLINEDATEIGAPADGPGEEGDATREKGYLAYYEICENIAKSDEWEVVQPNPAAMGPYAFRLNQWVGYDDEDIVRAKSRYVIEKKLGGIMFWSIDNDDFRGKCHGRPYPLIEAAKEELLAGSERVQHRQKTKTSDNRKKTRTQGGQRIQPNAIGRKLTAGNRRTTTQAAASRRRVTSTRPNARGGSSKADDEDEEEEDEEEVNVVKAVEKPRPRPRAKSRSKSRAAGGGRRKSQDDTEKGESLSNSFTTPEPPTTPDPGSDFKCEDEGFFSHPRDCKKYFWCLDSGPGGLGVVAHQFTCPSGLVFNKAADSCDYPRNVVCPKKAAPETVTSTRAPTTAARTTHLHKPTKRTTTTAKPEAESEEYEYYDDEEVEDSEEVEDEPRTTTTSKPLQYKTINRSRPTTSTSTSAPTTTTTTTEATVTSVKTDRVASFEDEEDPRVLKELIDLIKKAGGIEQLEKQLHFQEKNSGGSGDKNESDGKSTPATISRSLYERVLSRQATRIAGSFLGSLSTTTRSPNSDRTERPSRKNSRPGFVNGPGGAQFEGLDDVPEVKSLRRTNKPKYVTIERHRSSTSESPAERDDEDDETADDDNTDVASSEDRAVSNPPQRGNTNRRVQPSYVNIRRPRPSTTTSENDVEVKDEENPEDEDQEDEEEAVTQRHRHVDEVETSVPKSRYTNVNRFRSTTSRNNEVDQVDDTSEGNEITTESPTTTTTTTTPAPTTTEKIIPVTEKSETSIPSTLEPSTTPESLSATFESSSTESSEIPLTVSPLKLVEESATEILLTTAPASPSSSSGSSTSVESFSRGTTVSAVSQPRPFGFPRRGRPTAPTSSSSVTEQSRPKVDSETLRLPTLKELVGYSTSPTSSIVASTSTISPTISTTTIVANTEARGNSIDRPKDRLTDLIRDPLDEDDEASENDAREVDASIEIYDNDVLGSEEIQERSFSTAFAAAEAENARSANATDFPKKSVKRVEVPVKILDDTDGEEVAQLVLLRLPESKLNSAILRPVFRVKILEQDRQENRNDTKKNEVRRGANSAENSLENELGNDNRNRFSRRRRVRINSSPIEAEIGEKSAGRVDETSRPRGRQRIIKARRRTRVNEAADRSGEPIFTDRANDRADRISGDRRIDGRLGGDKEIVEETTIPAFTLEPSTTLKITTIRGNRPTSSKPSKVTRGFYITRSSDDVATTIVNPIVTDAPIDSTDFPSTLGELEISTKIVNAVESLENIDKSTSENYETTADYSSTENGISELPDATIVTSTEEAEATKVSVPSITTFRPFVTREPVNDPTMATDSTGSTDDATEGIDKSTVTNFDDFTTGNVGETLKTSENSNYGSFRNREAKSSTVPMTTDEISVTSQTEIPVTIQTEIPSWRTTNLVEKTTTFAAPTKRGRVRFTANAKPGPRAESTVRDHPRRTTTTSTESDVSDINSVTSTPVEEIPTFASRYRNRNRQRTATRSPPSSRSSPRNFDRSRKTTEVEDVRLNSVTPTESTTRILTSAESLVKVTEPEVTTEYLETEDVKINSVTPTEVTSRISTSAEIYDKVTDPEVTTEKNDWSTNSAKSTVTSSSSGSSSRSSRRPDQTRRTTEYFEAEDVRVNSVTPTEFTSTNDVTTETYDKTGEPTITTESTDVTASLVEITARSRSRSRSRSSIATRNQSQKTTTPFEASDTSTIPTTSPIDATTLSHDAKIEDDPEATTKVIDIDDTTASIAQKISTSVTTIESEDTKEKTNTFAASTLNDVGSTTEISQKPMDSSEPTSTMVPVTGGGETISTKSVNNLETTVGSSEPMSTIDLVTGREETSPTESTNDLETTKISEDKTETANASSEATVTESIALTTEIYASTDRTSTAMETSATDGQTSEKEKEEKSTEAIPPIWESTTTPEVENRDGTETTREFYSTAASSNGIIDGRESTIPADKITGEIKSTEPEVTRGTTENYEKNSYSTVELSYNSVTPEVSIRTTENSNKNSYSTIDSSYNSVTPEVTIRTTENSNNSYSTVDSSYNSVTPEATIRTIENSIKNYHSTVDSSYNSVTPEVTIRTTENSIKNSYSTVDSSYNSVTPEVTIRTTENSVKKSYSPVDSSYNSIAPEVTRRTTETTSEWPHNSITSSAPRETKRTRGRVRFTNFAANVDEAGRTRRPVKQVVVRRRPATPVTPSTPTTPATHRQFEDSSAEAPRRKIPANRRSSLSSEIEKSVNGIADDESANPKSRVNSTSSPRRRVVVYRGRPRPATTTTTTPTTSTTLKPVQSPSVSINDVSGDAGGRRRRKWRKRLVSRRARTDDLEDQSIAESGHFHRMVIDDLVDVEDPLEARVSIEPPPGERATVESQDVGDGEVNVNKNSGAFLRRPGTVPGRSRTPGTLVVGAVRAPGSPVPFSRIRPIETVKEDQSGRAQELAVTLADPPEDPAATSGRLPFRPTTRKISTTIAPRTEASVTPRTTPVARRRQKPRGNVERTVEVATVRPRRPAIIDYDYYVDDEVRLVVKPELKDKLFVTRKGGIRCLDQGNFAHPTSCKKFITCARMVNGQVLGTEYTCPDKLSFDPVGGICNWSAGLGCEDKSNP